MVMVSSQNLKHYENYSSIKISSKEMWAVDNLVGSPALQCSVSMLHSDCTLCICPIYLPVDSLVVSCPPALLSRPDPVLCAVQVSFLELYNEELTDLLALDTEDKDKRLRLLEDRSGVVAQGLEEVCVKSAVEIYQVGPAG